MDNENQKLDALTNQPIDILLNGVTFKARRATLYDVGSLNRFIKEKKDAGDDANLDIDSSLYIIWELIQDKEQYPDIKDYNDLAKKLSPFKGIVELTEALKLVGFEVPQSLMTAEMVSEQK